jgi:hypothetical protein
MPQCLASLAKTISWLGIWFSESALSCTINMLISWPIVFDPQGLSRESLPGVICGTDRESDWELQSLEDTEYSDDLRESYRCGTPTVEAASRF